MQGDPLLGRATARRLTCVLARIVRVEIRADTTPTPAECVSHTKAVYQEVATVYDAAASVVAGGHACSSSIKALTGIVAKLENVSETA